MSQRPPDSADDRRRATVMFVDILGAATLTAEAGIERAYAIVTGCLRVLEDIARRHNGMVDKYLSDCLMAVFGFPIAADDAPAAAVIAALEMLEAGARYGTEVASPVPLTFRIGINTGLMIAGDLRGPVVREFAVMGDAVNVAARLKDVGAPGEIHVGPETYEGARAHAGFAPLEPLALRGKEHRVPAYRVVGRLATGEAAGPPAVLIETAFVDREAERELLRDEAATSAREGRQRTVLLIGDEGIGKTRLVAELRSDVAAHGPRVLAAAARASGAAVPWSLLGALLADVGGLASPPEASRVADVLDGLAAERGLVIALEDLQWADAASLDLVTALARRAAAVPILWLLTTRPAGDRTETLVAALGPEALLRTIGPLAPAAAAALVDAVTGGRALSEEARARIEARAAGNPERLILAALLAGAVETEVEQEAATVERGSEAERRRVTVLFADITGFTRMSEQLPPSEAYRAVSGCLRLLHEVATKHGGSVDKYLGDCIMATFGVPIALEDAPRAAVNAAIEMRRRVREYNATAALPSPLDIHVGINTGLGVAGDVSGALLREFTLMGEAVSQASKLKDVAPAGEIWVGAETYHVTAGTFAYEAVPRAADAPSALTEAWALRSEREQVYRPRVGRGATIFTELVGRDGELALLRARLAELAAGRGSVVSVVGEPGLGKSRLLAELAASPEASAVRWIEGRSVAMGRTLRFHPFVDLLRSLLGLPEETTGEAFERLDAALAPLLGARREELAPYLAMLVGIELPPAAAARVATVRADLIDRLQLGAVRALFQAVAAERPLVLFFEDVYWADRSSVELLANVIRLASEAPVLFLFAARPGFPETSGHLVEVARTAVPARALVEMTLRPLDAAGTTRLLATLFPHGALPRASRDRMAERAAGNPLFLEELLRALIAQGAIEVTAAGLRATAAIESTVVPATVQEVILTRVDLLRPQPKLTLQLAAVVGQRVAEPVLAALVSEPETLPATLAELTDSQMLVQDQRGDVPSYAFKHRLIQDVTYESILETRRAELHRSVGRVIEERLVGAPGYHGMLAYHYSMGGDLERAEEQLFLAGDDAARAGAPTEALELLQESSRLYLARFPAGGDPAKRVALHKRLAGAYFHRGQLEEASRNYDQALAFMGAAPPASRLGVALRLAGTLGLVVSDVYLRGGGRSGRPTATARDLEMIDLMFSRARTQTIAVPARFLLDTFETLRKLRRVDPDSVQNAGGMYASVIGIFSYSGISFDIGRRFLALAERHTDPESVPETFLCRMMAFVHHWCAGEWDAGYEIPEPVVDAALGAGQLWEVVTHLGLESFRHLAQGRFADCTHHIDRLDAIAETYAYDLAHSFRRAGTAFLQTERRQLAAAALAADVYLAEHDEVLLNLLGFATRAKVLVLQGDLAGAGTALAAADALLAKGQVPPWHYGFVMRSHLLREVAECEHGPPRRGRWLTSGRRLAKKARWAADRFAWLQPEVYRLIGELRWAVGHRRAALHWFGRGLDVAERLAARPEAARTRLELARRLLDAGGSAALFRGRDARTWLREARETFDDLRLDWDLARLELVLANVGGRAWAASVR